MSGLLGLASLENICITAFDILSRHSGYSRSWREAVRFYLKVVDDVYIFEYLSVVQVLYGAY